MLPKVSKSKPTAPTKRLSAKAPASQEPEPTENESLKKELQDIKALHDQLLREKSNENFDERRIHLLKSQIFHLERQVMMLNDAVNSKVNTALQVSDSIMRQSAEFQKILGNDTPGALLSIDRGTLSRWIHSCESMRRNLFTTAEPASSIRVDHPFLTEPIALIDLLKVPSLNRSKLSELESHLMNLYRHLICFSSLDGDEQFRSQLAKLSGECALQLLDLCLVYSSTPAEKNARHNAKTLPGKVTAIDHYRTCAIQCQQQLATQNQVENDLWTSCQRELRQLSSELAKSEREWEHSTDSLQRLLEFFYRMEMTPNGNDTSQQQAFIASFRKDAKQVEKLLGVKQWSQKWIKKIDERVKKLEKLEDELNQKMKLMESMKAAGTGTGTGTGGTTVE